MCLHVCVVISPHFGVVLAQNNEESDHGCAFYEHFVLGNVIVLQFMLLAPTSDSRSETFTKPVLTLVGIVSV